MKNVAVRLPLCFSAMAIGAFGFLTLPWPALAKPSFGCNQWGFDGVFALRQSNGFVVDFGEGSPYSVSGRQAHANSGRDFLQSTKIKGSVIDELGGIDFTITWNAELEGFYIGSVGQDGKLHGSTGEVGKQMSTTWDSTKPLKCIKPEP